MATYTMTIQEMVTQPTQHRDDLTMKQRIDWGRSVLFDDMEYPFFNERYQREFETHLIRHFFTREIGYETEWLFKFKLETWLQINMPYYNQLFESELIKYDPLSNINMRTQQDTQKDKVTDSTQDTDQTDTGDSTTKSSFDHTGNEQVGEMVTGNEDTDTTNQSITDMTVDGTNDTDTNRQSDTNVLSNGTDKTDTNNQSDTHVLSNGTDNTDTENQSESTTDTTGDENTTSHSENKANTTVDGSSDTETDGTSDTSTDSTTNTDSFNRQIQSDTPNERLELSSAEGSGVIEYASGITENKETGNTDTLTNTNTTDSQTTGITSLETTDTSGSEDGTNDVSRSELSSTNATESGNTSTTRNDETDTGVTETGNTTTTRTAETDTGVTETDSTNTTHSTDTDSTVNDTGNTHTDHSQNTDRDTDTQQSGWDHSRTDTNNSMVNSVVGNVKGNELENFINQRNGKEGSITYQQMVQELRQTFLRIERDIFKEMNDELFMLVY